MLAKKLKMSDITMPALTKYLEKMWFSLMSYLPTLLLINSRKG